MAITIHHTHGTPPLPQPLAINRRVTRSQTGALPPLKYVYRHGSSLPVAYSPYYQPSPRLPKKRRRHRCKFHLFPLLPPELRIAIWRIALSSQASKLIDLVLEGEGGTYRCYVNLTAHRLMQVGIEARNIALERYRFLRGRDRWMQVFRAPKRMRGYAVERHGPWDEKGAVYRMPPGAKPRNGFFRTEIVNGRRGQTR